MSTGFVYIMINPILKGLVKIGRTKRTSKNRAQELRTTGLPDDFIVVYDELVTDSILVEKKLHKRFDDYRYQRNREFFQIPIRDAIRALLEESVGFVVPQVGSLNGVEILPDLKKKYFAYLKPDFHSIKIVHIDGIVFLESVRHRSPNLKDEIIERVDLSFITSDNGDMFPSSYSPLENARLFVHQLDEYSMINCTDLFTLEACEKINNSYKNRYF